MNTRTRDLLNKKGFDGDKRPDRALGKRKEERGELDADAKVRFRGIINAKLLRESRAKILHDLIRLQYDLVV